MSQSWQINKLPLSQIYTIYAHYATKTSIFFSLKKSKSVTILYFNKKNKVGHNVILWWI